MDKCRSYCISRQVLISCLICQVLTNISVMAVGACIAIDPRKLDVKAHGFIMLILSVMFLCILAVGAVGTIGEYTSILLLFAVLMVVGSLVGGFTHIMVFLTSATQENVPKFHLNLEDYERETSSKIAWDRIHEQDKCCGVTGPDDWFYVNIKIPSSCCHPFDGSEDPLSEHCAKFNGTEYIYRRGCPKTWEKENREFISFQKETKPETNDNKSTKIRSNFQESVINLMVFDYLSKILCIVSAVILAWLLW